MKKFFRDLFSAAAATVLAAAAATVCAVTASAQGQVSIDVSPSQPGVGDIVTVNVEFSSDNMDIQYAEANLEYDSSVMEVADNSDVQGSGGVLRLRGYAEDAPSVNFVIKFKTVSEGSSNISITNSSLTDMSNGSLGSPTASSSVNVSGESSQSDDSTLGSLNVTGGGQLQPAFSPDVTSYTVELPDDVTTVQLQGSTSNVKSYIMFSGGFSDIVPVEGTSPTVYSGTASLNSGDNIKYITVTAENGDETQYTINLIRGAGTATTTTTEEQSESQSSSSGGDTQSGSQQGSSESTVTTAPDDMNIMKNTISSSYSAPSKGPNEDSVLNGVFPVIILGIFVVFIALFVVITWIKMQADKKRREQAHRRKKVQQQKQYAAKQMESYNRSSRQGSSGGQRPGGKGSSGGSGKGSSGKGGSGKGGGTNIRKLK